MSVFHNNILGGAAGQTGGAADAAAGPIKSVRFNNGDSPYLNRTPSSASNRRTFTWAAWVKRGVIDASASRTLFSAGSGGFDVDLIVFYGHKLQVLSAISSINWNYVTTALFRDPSAWYHITVAVDTTNSTASDRVKIYVNGTRITEFDTSSAPSQNYENNINSTDQHAVSYDTGNIGYYFDGYIADLYLIDGQQLDPTSFGAFDDNGVWQAAEYTGTFGTNGFHLFDFANESGIGSDSSGNDNDFTVNNLTASTLDYSTSGGAVTNAGNALDGNDNTYSQTSTGENSTYTFSPAISVSSGRIDLRARNHSSLTYKAVTNAGTITFTLQGTWPGSGHVDYPGWYYISNASVTSISQIILETSDSSVNWTFTGFQVAGSPSSVGDQFVTAVPSSDLDILFDVPTNGTQSDTGAGGEVSGNYCTWNPLALQPSGHGGLRQGNLEIIADTAGSHKATLATFALPSTGKYYWEVKAYRTGGTNNGGGAVGVAEASAVASTAASGTRLGEANSSSWVLGLTSFDALHANTADYSDYLNGGTVETDTGIIGIAVDMDNDKMWMHYNGVYGNAGGTGNPATGANPMFSGEFSGKTLFPAAGITVDSGSGYLRANFGQRPFAVAAPSGFKPLCTTNLPTPTIADGSDYFDALTWTGDNAVSRTLTGLEFSPDFIWHQARSIAWGSGLVDAVRGVGSGGPTLRTFNNSAEETVNNFGAVTALTSDGFTVSKGGFGSNQWAYVNQSGATYVAWTWDAGTSTVSNTDGSITSSVRANPSAGFSIVSYSGSGSNATVGHGLNAALDFIIIKRRNTTGEWRCWHSALSNTQGIDLNSTGAAFTDDSFNNTIPTSSVFTVKGGVANVNATSSSYVAYCFSAVAGYSAFGSYEGNGSADGPFVYCGFKPRWIMMKNADTSGTYYDWRIIDTARHTYNAGGNEDIPPTLFANKADAEVDWDNVDILSNGFKIKDSSVSLNESGATQIFIAFAENPFQANGGLAR